MPSTLAYWKCQALCHPIRFALRYVEEEFEDKFYTHGPEPEYSNADWIKEKFSLGFDFPNLPYYIDGNVKLTQSNTILRYIGRKYNIGGITADEKIRVDLTLDQVMDNRHGMAMICNHIQHDMKQDFDTLKEEYVKKIPDTFKQYEDFLRDDFITGENVTVADFPLYAMLKEHQLLVPDCLQEFSKLQAFIERIENLRQIKKYMESENYPKLNLYREKASFGGDTGY